MLHFVLSMFQNVALKTYSNSVGNMDVISLKMYQQSWRTVPICNVSYQQHCHNSVASKAEITVVSVFIEFTRKPGIAVSESIERDI